MARNTSPAPLAGNVGNTHTYQRHRPETTLLYQLVEQHYSAFQDHLADQGKPLPTYRYLGSV